MKDNKKEKEELLKFIRSYTKITITSICKENNIRVDNLIHGTTSLENIKLVKDELKKKIIKWLADE